MAGYVAGLRRCTSVILLCKVTRPRQVANRSGRNGSCSETLGTFGHREEQIAVLFPLE